MRDSPGAGANPLALAVRQQNRLGVACGDRSVTGGRRLLDTVVRLSVLCRYRSQYRSQYRSLYRYLYRSPDNRSSVYRVDRIGFDRIDECHTLQKE